MTKRRRFFASLCAAGLASISSASLHAANEDANVLALAQGDTVPITIIPAGVFLRVTDDPVDEIWKRVPEYQVGLEPAPPVHASVVLRQTGDAEPVALFFSIVSDRTRLYVKLRWVDPTPDVETTANRFRDGAAVQFALSGGEATTHMMGSPENPVNIWYWRSDDHRAENLAAGGFGSTTLLDEQSVTANAAYGSEISTETNEWTVVLSRPLNGDGEYLADFSAGTIQPLAFAVWDGAEGQRDGHKRASTGWIKVDLAALAGG